MHRKRSNTKPIRALQAFHAMLFLHRERASEVIAPYLVQSHHKYLNWISHLSHTIGDEPVGLLLLLAQGQKAPFRGDCGISIVQQAG